MRDITWRNVLNCNGPVANWTVKTFGSFSHSVEGLASPEAPCGASMGRSTGIRLRDHSHVLRSRHYVNSEYEMSRPNAPRY